MHLLCDLVIVHGSDDGRHGFANHFRDEFGVGVLVRKHPMQDIDVLFFPGGFPMNHTTAEQLAHQIDSNLTIGIIRAQPL